MPFKLIGRTVGRLADRWARQFGYVPVSELAALTAERNTIEQNLVLKTRNLEHTIEVRDRMDKEIEFLRALQLAHVNEETDLQKAVITLESTIAQLQTLMQDTWPAAIVEEQSPATAP